MEQPLDRLGPLHETVVHRLEVQEELGDVLQELAPQDPVGDLVEGPARHVDDTSASLAAHPVGHRQPPQETTPEELGHPRRRLEEVEGVPGRRRVDDDEVVRPGGVDLEQSLHRDVVVALDEARREVGVQAVLEDPVRRHFVGRVPEDQLVPRALGVEHRRVQLAPRFEPRSPDELIGHPSFGVADAVEPERAREPPRGIDREHQHLPTQPGGGAEQRSRRQPRSCRHRPSRRTRRSPSPREAARGSAGSRHCCSQSQLLADRFCDHAGDAQPVRTNEEVRHVEHRELDRGAESGEVHRPRSA